MGDEAMLICYNDNNNTFEDEMGQIEYDISDIMPIDQILFFKKNGGTYYTDGSRDEHDIQTFAISFPIRDLERSIYYDRFTNMFDDEYGELVFNIFSIITPNDLLLFKQNKKTIFVNNLKGGVVKMVYEFGK